MSNTMGRRASALPSVVEEWHALNKEFPDLENLQKDYNKAVHDFKTSEENSKKALIRQVKGVNRISEYLMRLSPSDESENDELSKLRKIVNARREELRDMLSTLPRDSGLYLKIVLGNVSVGLLNQESKFKYKDEYERFKLVVTIITLGLSFFNILFPFRTMDSILHFLMVWYYCTLTIRESILVANGSRIKGWWRTHHFLTTLLAGVIILWHDKDSYQLFRSQFLWYVCYTSFLQFLQCNYQQGCLYRLRALGEGHNMDITVDGFHTWMWRGLKFLLPFLIAGYCWQLLNAYTLYEVSMQTNGAEWQVSVAALIFFILFSGNSLTTAMIVHQKLNLKGFILRKLQ